MKSKSPVVKGPALQKQLTGLTPPVYYLDFEAVGMLDPPYEGMVPYETYVTQYSLHKSCSAIPTGQADSDLVHSEFLADPERDCREELVASLLEDLGTQGSIVVYSPYERTQLKKLAKDYPAHSGQVRQLLGRLVDFEKLIRETVVLPEFRGRTSIKVTLPSLRPKFQESYKRLADETGIADGGAANAKMTELIRGDIVGEEAEVTKRALLEYCKLDTLAMVEIHKALWELLTDADSTSADAEKSLSSLGPSDLSTFTVVQLKEMLREKRLPVSGKKAVLIERLQQSPAK